MNNQQEKTNSCSQKKFLFKLADGSGWQISAMGAAGDWLEKLAGYGA